MGEPTESFLPPTITVNPQRKQKTKQSKMKENNNPSTMYVYRAGNAQDTVGPGIRTSHFRSISISLVGWESLYVSMLNRPTDVPISFGGKDATPCVAGAVC